MATATVSAKGWVVIPKELRQKYSLKRGDKVVFVEYAGHIAVVPVAKDPVGEARGILKNGDSLTEALVAERRRERERERGAQ